jgi:hypothetical protein
MAAGFTEADLEEAARLIYFSSPGARANPEYKHILEREKQRREGSGKAEMALARVQELEQRLESERMQYAAERKVSEFLDNTVSAVDDESPFVQRAVAKNGGKARQALRDMAEHIAAETREPPDPSEVVKQLEKKLRADLEELGVDLEAVTKSTAPVGQRKAARTLSNEIGSSTKPRPVRSRDEEKEDLLRSLESGNLD